MQPDEGRAEVQVVDEVATVVLAGEVDVAVAPALRDRALAQLTPPLRQIRVDLAACRFLDSAGVSALAAFWRRAKELDAGFALVDPPRNVRVVLAITGFIDFVDDGPEKAHPPGSSQESR